VYVFAGLAPPDQFEAAQRQFVSSIRSFRSLSESEAANIRPSRVQLYTVRSGDTWQSIAARAGDGAVKPATLAIMNNSDPSRQPPPGDRIKIVVEG
jgi:predicted Zn-dependent protease